MMLCDRKCGVMRTLIVDDSSFMREYLRQNLEQFGAACTEATNGDEALQRLRGEQKFELMLIDLNMPVMNGLECVARLRAEGLTATMSIMMVTTEADSSFIERALECGAHEFLMKPFTPQSLREKLHLLGFLRAS